MEAACRLSGHWTGGEHTHGPAQARALDSSGSMGEGERFRDLGRVVVQVFVHPSTTLRTALGLPGAEVGQKQKQRRRRWTERVIADTAVGCA